MRTYRNKFVAHLDAERVMQIPALDIAYESVEFYFSYLTNNEAATGDLAGLPTDLDDYRRWCEQGAKKVYN